MFVLSFKNGNDDLMRLSFDEYYMSLVEIKNFNLFINNKTFFWLSSKKKQEMSRNNDYTTESLLDYLYHQRYYKLVGIDLSRQTNTSIHNKLIFQEN